MTHWLKEKAATNFKPKYGCRRRCQYNLSEFPMLDQMFDFEKKIVMETKADAEQFMKSGNYLYLRSGMIERWNTLNEFHTYPNMLRPLKIN